MARFENHFIQLTEALVEVFDGEIQILSKGEESIFLLRQAGHDVYGARRYRTRDMQSCESLLHRMETILDKTGILRDECILSVVDAFIVLHREDEATKRGKSRAEPLYIAQHLQDVLRPFREQV